MGSNGPVYRSEYLFRGLFGEAPLGIAIESLDGDLLVANPALCTLLGYNREELERMSCADFAHPADSSDDLELFRKLRGGEIDRYEIEKRYVRKDGNPLWGRLYVSLLKSANGEPDRVLALVEDITAHKNSDEVRSRHVATTNSCHDAIICTDIGHVINGWNKGATQLFGYGEAEAVGKPITLIVPPELWDEEFRRLTQLEVEGEIEDHQTVRVGKDGRTISVQLNASPVRNSNGAIVGFCEAFHEYGESKRLSKALHESEEKFRKVFREAGVGMVTCSLEGAFLSANVAFCAFLGYSESEIVGRSLQTFVHAEDWFSWSRWFREGTGFHGIEKRFLHKSGRVLTADTSAAVIRGADGNALYFVCHVVDITERKRAEQALRQRERDLVEAQRVAGVGSWQWNVEARSLICSKEFHRIAGRDPSESPLRFEDFWRIFTAETSDRLRRAMDETLNQQSSYEFEGNIVRADGTMRWIVMRGEAQRNSKGDIALVRGTVQDITERKRAEKDLRDLSARFVTAQEQERSYVARELHDDVGQRLALAVVTLDRFRETPPNSAEEVRGVIDELFERISDISAEVHQLSHQLHPSTLRLGLITALRTLSAGMERQHGVHVTTVFQDIPDSLRSDISLCVYRVAQEALSNVVKHSGVKDARLELVGSPRSLALRIVDSGRGFESTTQGESGLGLLSMRERARLTGGSLTIRSQASEGTEVLLELPMGQDARRFPATAGK